jgi:hypothetical protein
LWKAREHHTSCRSYTAIAVGRGRKSKPRSTPCTVIEFYHGCTRNRRRTLYSATFFGRGSRWRLLCTLCTWTFVGRVCIWMLRRKACTGTLFFHVSIWRLRHSLCNGNALGKGNIFRFLCTSCILTFGWHAGMSRMQGLDQAAAFQGVQKAYRYPRQVQNLCTNSEESVVQFCPLPKPARVTS